jgi:CelD/BcsL family acetyltransferase involved in cellulose biosynthesis
VSTSVRIVQEFGTIDNEAQRWTLLSDEANRPMHQYGWVKACSAAFAAYGRLQLIVIGRDGEQPGALGPLIMRGRHLNRMECLGVDELYEPTDFPHSDPASLNALVRTLVDLRRPLLLRRLLANSPVLAAVREAFTSRGILMTRPATGYPWIELDASWMQPEQKLSSGWRSSLRRSRRKAEDMGRLEYEIVAPSPQELPELLAESLRIEAANWKGRNGSALLSDTGRRQFFEDYTATACERGILRLCFLKIGGVNAATQIAVESGGGFWLLKVGYDESFSRSSPGNLLMLESLRYAANRGLKSYEFLGSAEPWTERWTNRVRPCVSVWVYPNNFRGAAALAFDAVRFASERLSRGFSHSGMRVAPTDSLPIT